MIAGPAAPPADLRRRCATTAKRSAQNQARRSPRHLHAEPGAAHAQPGPGLRVDRRGHLLGERVIINSLEGVDVTVQRIGATTCGKPYGQARDNCGTPFPIEFQGVNARGWKRLRERLHAHPHGGRRPGAQYSAIRPRRARGRAHAARQRRPPLAPEARAQPSRDACGTGQRRRAGQAPGAQAPTAAGRE